MAGLSYDAVAMAKRLEQEAAVFLDGTIKGLPPASPAISRAWQRPACRFSMAICRFLSRWAVRAYF